MFNKPLKPVLRPVYLFILLAPLLFVYCSGSKYKNVLQHADMRDFHQLRWEQDSTVLVIAGNGSFFTKPIELKKGKYTIVFKADGNIANNELPHFVVRLGDFLIKEMRIKEKVNEYVINFELPESVTMPLQFTFDNDYNDATGDRNIFLYYPVTIKSYQAF